MSLGHSTRPVDLGAGSARECRRVGREFSLGWHLGIVPRACAVVALFLVGSLTTVACSGTDADQGSSSRWVTFESSYVAVDLPDSFSGGDPREDGVVAALEEIAARNPDPVFAQYWKSYLAGLESDTSRVSTELVMWREPNADGYMAMVTAKRTELSAFSEWTSLEEFVQLGAVLNSPPDYTHRVESVTKNWAYMVVRDATKEDPGEVLLYHQVHVVDDECLYTVFYRFDTESDYALEEIYRASADSISVSGR